MFEFEKIARTGKSFERDNGGTCYLFPNEEYYSVNWLTDDKRSKGYRIFTACVDVVTIPSKFLEHIEDAPAFEERDIITVTYQFVTRAKTKRGIIDAAVRRAYEIGPWCYIPACISAIWGDDFSVVKDIKFGAYYRLER